MIEQLSNSDQLYALGFFTALALRRGRIDAIVGGLLATLPVGDRLDPDESAGSSGATSTAANSKEGKAE